MSETPKVGVASVDGSAVRGFRLLKDDNHSLPADEDEALANFDSFSSTFFRTQDKFIETAERQISSRT